jgi:hypothetical protein
LGLGNGCCKEEWCVALRPAAAEPITDVTNPVTTRDAEQEGGKMLEIILGVVCLGVVAVEVIEVRQKCEEPRPGTWYGASTLQAYLASPTGVCENGLSI